MKNMKNMKKLFLVTLIFLLLVGVGITASPYSSNLLSNNPYSSNTIQFFGKQAVFGSIWGHDSGVVEIDSSQVYYNITNLSNGLNKNMLIDSDNLTILRSGVYSVTSQISFSDGANTEFHLALGINGVKSLMCHSERVIGTGGDTGSVSYSCFIELDKWDVISPMIENLDNTNNPTIHDLQLNLLKID